jgi:hypothetical protein
LSIATIDEVLYPVKCVPLAWDEARESWTPFSCNDEEGYRLCMPPSSSLIICKCAQCYRNLARRELRSKPKIDVHGIATLWIHVVSVNQKLA